ncbi:hypothetical protein PoB_005246800 [Plakobranchus ocellatus]|uniref:Uncharacterized protein n=1 Tax=Plakobranchus ocellatus TaxID=259542 RepID=A0AAV4C4P7_9GAST|nr:hypothetical protein PoB_005246800 [Plakobranchus ocellatus]
MVKLKKEPLEQYHLCATTEKKGLEKHQPYKTNIKENINLILHCTNHWRGLLFASVKRFGCLPQTKPGRVKLACVDIHTNEFTHLFGRLICLMKINCKQTWSREKTATKDH